MEGGRAAGVRVRSKTGPEEVATDDDHVADDVPSTGRFIRARRGVISNASVWDTQKILPDGAGTPEWREGCRSTPQVGMAG